MKTFKKTFVIGAAIVAAAILAPAAFAQGRHGPPPRPSNGIQLAADIVNLVRAVIEPRPAPVIVAPRERIITTTPVITTTPTVVTTPTTTTVVTEAIPEYSYSYYFGEYVPYYEGWFYYADDWIWGGIGPRPPAPPRWAPPRHGNPPPPPRTVVRPEPRGHSAAPAARREAPRTVVVRPEKKSNTVPVVPSQHRVPRKNGR